MAKNIVICCDGTGNDFDQPDTDSNVVKLYNALAIGPDQLAYYHPGVGTMGAPNAQGPIGKKATQIGGLAFGSGLLANVADAYRYLMNTYEKGDQIYLFGFSRGAYTARAVGSLLHVFGLMELGNEQLIPYILRLYSVMTKSKVGAQDTFPTEDAFKYAFSREVEVHFCGLWDTVSTYGWINSPIELPFSGQNPIIRTGRHAISIHERRSCFQDNLWGPSIPGEDGKEGQDIRQVWFAGVHSDVGGSYRESESGLSKITFEWMLVEAVKKGLMVDVGRAKIVLGDAAAPAFLPKYVGPDAHGLMHESLCGSWWGLEFFPRRKCGKWSLPRGKWRRVIPEGSLIHASVALTGKPVTLPAAYTEEPWAKYAPENYFAVVPEVQAVAEPEATKVPLVPSMARR